MSQIEHSRNRSALIALVVCAALTLCNGAGVNAQIVHGEPPSFGQGLNFLSWDLSGDTDITVQEWHVPVMVRAGLRENVELAVYGALLNATADWDVEDDAISGLTDSKIQVSASFLADQVLVSAGVSLPTGQHELSRDEQALLGWLTSDFLNFPVKNPGEGLNLFGQLGMATPAGLWVFGASAAVYMAGEYQPYDNNRDYKPGSRLVLDLGGQREWPAHHRVACDVIIIYSTDDKVDGEKVFRDGIQVDTRVQGTLAIGKSALEGGLRFIVRAKDKLAGEDEDLVTEINNRHGNDVRLHLLGRTPIGEALGVWASIDAKFLSSNDYPEGHPFFEDAARLTGFGGGVDFSLGPRTRAGIGLRAWSGSSDGALGLEELKFKGFEIVEHLTVTF